MLFGWFLPLEENYDGNKIGGQPAHLIAAGALA